MHPCAVIPLIQYSFFYTHICCTINNSCCLHHTRIAELIVIQGQVLDGHASFPSPNAVDQFLIDKAHAK